MKKTIIALAVLMLAALTAPAFASVPTSAKKTQLEQLAKKSGGKHKSGKAPKKG